MSPMCDCLIRQYYYHTLPLYRLGKYALADNKYTGQQIIVTGVIQWKSYVALKHPLSQALSHANKLNGILGINTMARSCIFFFCALWCLVSKNALNLIKLSKTRPFKSTLFSMQNFKYQR